MCEALQRTYDAGLSADGVLSTEHESGVAHVHQLLLAALVGLGDRRRYAAVAVASRTRVRPEVRRQQILEATHRVTLARGLHDLRIGDVADELHVSTGLIHYHFATKDELIEAMLRDTAEREVAAGRRRRWPASTTAEERLATLIETYLPSLRRDPSWVLWIDAWGEALRDANRPAHLRGARRRLGAS